MQIWNKLANKPIIPIMNKYAVFLSLRLVIFEEIDKKTLKTALFS